MARRKITIQAHKAGIFLDEHVVFLNDTYVKKRKIPTNQPISLRFGAFQTEVKVVPVKALKEMRVSEWLLKKLGIGRSTELCLKYKPDTRMLSIGPVLGVMISRVYPDQEDRPFGPITAFCKELFDACRIYGAFAYFFTPDGIGDSIETLEGWSYNGKWQPSLFPAPDVVYNRLTSRKYENKPSVQHFVKEVKSRYDAHVFNEKYLNKTEVFEALAGDPALQKYLPESHLFKNYQMLKTMCGKYMVVFLKPITGSLGKGIIRITRRPKEYVCHLTNVNGAARRSFPSLAKLFASISGKMKRNQYQIQQGLNLISVNGRPVDFRALVQRNASGEWVITSIVGRIAGTNHFVSNLARGGRLSPVGNVLAKSNLAAGNYANVVSRLRLAAIALAKGVGTRIPGHYGELGIDLAVDTAGKVWLLEINSKPSKDDNSSLHRKIRPSVRQLVRYVRYLANF